IPKKRDEKILPLSSYPQNGGISPKEEQRRGKKTIMRRWRELLEKWNRKREGVQNEAKGENTGIDRGEEKCE
ncbi:MAG: hypothetical protein V2G52_05405, partial [bacterium JZ-2024 1]